MPEDKFGDQRKYGLYPLLNKECIKRECAWYYYHEGRKERTDMCSIP